MIQFFGKSFNIGSKTFKATMQIKPAFLIGICREDYTFGLFLGCFVFVIERCYWVEKFAKQIKAVADKTLNCGDSCECN